MVYTLLGICIGIMLFGIYIVLRKMSLAQYYIAKRRRKKDKKKHAISRHVRVPHILQDDIEDYERQLFDDVSALFLQRPPYSLDLQDAAEIQDDVMRKMPVKTVSHVRQLDLEEWSIYWQLESQSLEYYVGKYGVFYAHVDRFGQEHTQAVPIE